MVGFGTSGSKSNSGDRIVVGVGEMALIEDQGDSLSTYALGSCVGVVLFDQQQSLAAMLHVMLPDSEIAPDKAKKQPHLFADTGLDDLLQRFVSKGGQLKSCSCAIAGGASVMATRDIFKIGEKNQNAVKSILKEAGIAPEFEFVGGKTNRTLHFKMATGELSVIQPNETKEVVLK